MKKILLTALAAVSIAASSYGQAFFEAVTFTGAFPPINTPYTAKIEGGFTEHFANGDWTDGWVNWYPNSATYPAPTSTLEGDVTSDRTLSGTVEMKGTVHVRNGATLTIAAGTVIRAGLGATLIITKGSKINAIGTRTNPIVFTSIKAAGQRSPGDWAGILIIGNSQVNTSNGTRQYEALPNNPYANYGGGLSPVLNENSGEMRFVRVEFGGYNYLPDQELNGLTLGAVGSGTKINFIQVSYARDDAFEWFGGTSNHKYLVSLGTVDDDFDMDEGYAGNVQFIIAVKNPAVFETAAGGTSHGFEHDNNTGLGSASQVVPGNSNPTPNTAPFISNATLIGPWTNNAPTSGNKFGRGLEMRSAVATSIYNTLVFGYQTLAQLVHPSVTIEPSTGFRLLKAQGNADPKLATITPAEYRNVHLIASNFTSAGFAFTSAPNQPSSPSFSFSSYMQGTNGNSGFASAVGTLFHDPMSSYTTSESVSFCINPSSPVAAVQADFTGLIAPKTLPPTATAILTPTLSSSKSSVSFGTKLSGSTFDNISFDVMAANLTGTGITINAPAGFSVTPTQLSLTNGSVSGTVTVSFAPTAVGQVSGNIQVTSADTRVPALTIGVSGGIAAPVTPFISTNVTDIVLTPLETFAPYSSNGIEVLVSGRNITGSGIAVSAPANFQVSTSVGSGYGSSVTLVQDEFGVVSSRFYVRLMSSASSDVSGSITLTNASTTKNVEVSATIAPSTSGSSASITISQNTGVVVSTLGVGFTVVGTRMTPGALVTISGVSGVEVSATSASAGFASMVTLTVNSTGRIAPTSANLWARYTGTLSGSSSGVTVGQVLVSGIAQPLPVSLRTIGAGAVNLTGNILSSRNSTFITGLGTNFTGDFTSSDGYVYARVGSSSVYLGRVKTVTGATSLELRDNALADNMQVNNLSGTITTMIASDTIIGTGTVFTAQLVPNDKIYISSGTTSTMIGTVLSILSNDTLVLSNVAGLTFTGTSYGNSIIGTQFRRAAAVLSAPSRQTIISNTPNPDGTVNPSAPRAVSFSATNIIPPVMLRLNPALTSSGVVFEISTTTVPGDFVPLQSITWNTVSGAAFSATFYVRYNPNNNTITGSPIVGSHSTEFEIFGNRNGVGSVSGTFGVSSNSNPSLDITSSLNVPNPTRLAGFSAYVGKYSEVQSFNITGSRIAKPVVVEATSGFEISKSNTSGFASALTLTGADFASTVIVYVRFIKNTAGSESGSISIATDGFPTYLLNVSGEAIEFASNSFIDVSSGGTNNLTLTSTIVSVTVDGLWLQSALTVSVSSADFSISTAADGTFGQSLSFDPVPSDVGFVFDKVVYIRYNTPDDNGKTATVTFASAGVSSVVLNLTGSAPTSLKPEVVATTFSLYPNPSTGEVKLAANVAETTDANVIVYSYTGTVVRAIDTTFAAGENIVNIEGLSSGLYIVRVKTKSGSKAFKLVVE